MAMVVVVLCWYNCGIKICFKTILPYCKWILFQVDTFSGEAILSFSLLPFAGPRSAVGRASDSYVRGPGFDTRSGHILSFLLPLIQEGQLSVTSKSMCTKYWLTP